MAKAAILINQQSITTTMALEEALKYPLEKRITLIFDYDLTMTEEWQQYHYFMENFNAIKKEYDHKRVIEKTSGDKKEMLVQNPADYFNLSDSWGEPHNGICYVEQMLEDGRNGILKNLTPEGLKAAGAKVHISPGLPQFFKKLKQEWKGKCTISAYIISVGLMDIIHGGSIWKSRHIDGVYATKLESLKKHWDKDKKADYNAASDIVTPFNKTAYLIEIAKGGKYRLNDIMPKDDYIFDYRNMLVFGDGTSDISAFAYARRKGSRIIAVYQRDSTEAYDKIRTNKHILDRCNAIKPRDYNRGTHLWNYINEKIERILKRKCNFPPELVDMYRKEKIEYMPLKHMVGKHLSKCNYCSNLLELSISAPENKAE